MINFACQLLISKENGSFDKSFSSERGIFTVGKKYPVSATGSQ